MSYRCLICAYDEMPHPPVPYNICPCCGVEYGLDDAFDNHAEVRDAWLLAGGLWFSEVKPFIRPPNWSAWDQLDLAEYPYNVPRPPLPMTIEYADIEPLAGFSLIDILPATSLVSSS